MSTSGPIGELAQRPARFFTRQATGLVREASWGDAALCSNFFGGAIPVTLVFVFLFGPAFYPGGPAPVDDRLVRTDTPVGVDVRLTPGRRSHAPAGLCVAEPNCPSRDRVREQPQHLAVVLLLHRSQCHPSRLRCVRPAATSSGRHHEVAGAGLGSRLCFVASRHHRHRRGLNRLCCPTAYLSAAAFERTSESNGSVASTGSSQPSFSPPPWSRLSTQGRFNSDLTSTLPTSAGRAAPRASPQPGSVRRGAILFGEDNPRPNRPPFLTALVSCSSLHISVEKSRGASLTSDAPRHARCPNRGGDQHLRRDRRLCRQHR